MQKIQQHTTDTTDTTDADYFMGVTCSCVCTWACILTLFCTSAVVFGCKPAPKQSTSSPTPMASPTVSTKVVRKRIRAGLDACLDGTLAKVPPALKKWQHKRSLLLAKSGVERHATQDVIVQQGMPAVMEAKFQYGRAFQGLENELVEVFLDQCHVSLSRLGSVRTDKDGWASIKVPARPPGVYKVMWRVPGDGTLATSHMWVLQKGSRLAIFDIDGTLAVENSAAMTRFIQKMVLDERQDKHHPKAYPGAVSVVDAYAMKSIIPVFLSGRPYWFGRHTRRWLDAMGFAKGPVLLPKHHRMVIPYESFVSTFKRRTLESMHREGFELAAVHGNSQTDIYAYTQPFLSIPRDQTYIIGPLGGRANTVAIAESWSELAKKVVSQGVP